MEYERPQQDRSQKWARILENATDVAVNDTDVFGDGDQSNIQAENISDRGSALPRSKPVGKCADFNVWRRPRDCSNVMAVCAFGVVREVQNLHWQI